MAALAVEEGLDVLEDRAPRPGTRRPAVPVQELELEGRKKLSTTAWSQQLPGRLRLNLMPWRSSTLAYASEVCWQPRFVW